MIKAVAYMRTSSVSNVGADKDSEMRQRAAISGYAAQAGFEIADSDWFYDAAVSGADPVTDRPGFAAMLRRLVSNGVKTIIVESPDRFARDLIIQLTGHDYLKSIGVDLVPASAPDFFTADTPTAVMIRQILGAVAQFEKANLVAKLKSARQRKREKTGKCSGRKGLAELRPEHVNATIRTAKQYPALSLRGLSSMLARQGILTPSGTLYAASAIKSMLNQGKGV